MIRLDWLINNADDGGIVGEIYKETPELILTTYHMLSYKANPRDDDETKIKRARLLIMYGLVDVEVGVDLIARVVLPEYGKWVNLLDIDKRTERSIKDQHTIGLRIRANELAHTVRDGLYRVYGEKVLSQGVREAGHDEFLEPGRGRNDDWIGADREALKEADKRLIPAYEKRLVDLRLLRLENESENILDNGEKPVGEINDGSEGSKQISFPKRRDYHDFAP